jgi:hypothetical protein
VKTLGPQGAAWGLLLCNIAATTYEVSAFFSALNNDDANANSSVGAARCPSYGA